MKNSSRKMYSLLALIGSFGYGFSQNMVINPNMDAECVSSGFGQITKTDTWTNANGGTVDLFDRTKPKNCYVVNAIPNNYMGTQASPGDQNYAGIIAYYDDGANNRTDSGIVAFLGLKDGYKKYSEYLQGELNAPLVAGKIYQISFKVNLADKSGRAVSCLGALLTPEKIEQKSNSFLKQQPQFITHRIISDSINWVTVYGTFIAAGGEKFITIGYFEDENFQMQKVVGPLQNDSRKAYYYISGVAVAPYVSKPDLDAIVYGVDYVEMMDLQFVLGSSEVAPQFHTELDEVGTWMRAHPEMSFFIAGYTDKTGNNSINDPLSLDRANAVKKYLVSTGVKESNLYTDGFGSSNPVVNKIKSRKNRRVEIYLYAVTKTN